MMCPCCQQSVEAMPLDKIAQYAPLTPSERKAFRFLASRFGQYVPTQRLIDYLYSDHRDGGPENARTCTYVFLSRMRRKIKSYGIGISGHESRGYDGGRMRMFWIAEKEHTRAA